MKETYETLNHPNLKDSPNAISLPGSASGATPCGSPDGPTTDRFGREAAHANLSARQASEKGLLTSGTYGRTGSISLNSASLSKSLANKLRVKTDLLGSTLFNLTWRERVTPRGRLICALRASVRRTSDNDYGSWPTPKMASWATPAAQEPGGNTGTASCEEEKLQRSRNKNGLELNNSAIPPSPTNGFWGSAEWINCKDGKARPIEPGTFPLAHGTPERVGRIRGYGNAIVAPAAAAFIEASMSLIDTTTTRST